MSRRTTRRAVLASTGLALAVGSGTTVGGQEIETDDDGTAVSASRLLEQPRYPRTRMNDGVAVQLDNCSQVRVYGDSSAAATVSIFTFYYTPQGNPWNDVLDLEADLPMTVDVNETYGDDAASDVVIGGVDVMNADGEQVVTMQAPDGWGCTDDVEPPAQNPQGAENGP